MAASGGRGVSQTWFVWWILFCLAASLDAEASVALHVFERPEGHSGGVHLPIFRRSKRCTRKRDKLTGQTRLGDYYDITYTVQVAIGGVSTPLVLDTGSSDLWVISDACTSCTQNVPFYPQSSFRPINGEEAKLFYGDSLTGTHAFGPIGTDTVDLAGMALQNQVFAAVNDTNTNVTSSGAAGIFGLGFPVNSALWRQLFSTASRSGIQHGPRMVNLPDLRRYDFPDLASLFPSDVIPTPNNIPPNVRFHPHLATTPSSIQSIFASFVNNGPLLSRLVVTGTLAAPHFTITLQRDTVDIGGNIGLLSIGALPPGVDETNLTWAKVRPYSVKKGGLPPLVGAPGEKYPIAWEVFIDDVFLDGVKLPRSSLSPSSIGLSALVDTGNSFLRGPADVVKAINNILSTGSSSSSSSSSPHFLCSQPHTLAFQIGGHLFPVDPRDLIHQEFKNDVQWCRANLELTDPPSSYLYSWSLGAPFLKSVLATFYYGNLTHPSEDPPKIGFISTVPADAGQRLKDAIAEAAENGGVFLATSERAPLSTGTPTSVVNISATAKPLGTALSNAGRSKTGRVGSTFFWVGFCATWICWCSIQ